MKVRLLVDTHYGERLKKGETADVPKDVAERWEKGRIAEPTEPTEPAEPTRRSRKGEEKD